MCTNLTENLKPWNKDDCICIFAVVIEYVVELNTMRMRSSHSRNIQSYYTLILHSTLCITAAIKRQQFQDKNKKSCLNEGINKFAVLLTQHICCCVCVHYYALCH